MTMIVKQVIMFGCMLHIDVHMYIYIYIHTPLTQMTIVLIAKRPSFGRKTKDKNGSQRMRK